MSSKRATRAALVPPRLDLDAVFQPRSVCLVGASADPHKLNGLPLNRLTRHGFEGRIWLVNPKRTSINGHDCFPSVDDLPEPVDVALVMVPADQVPETIAACGRKGVRAAVVLSSGFEETADGGARVARLVEAAETAGITLIGPNCEGVWSVAAKAILTFGSAAAGGIGTCWGLLSTFIVIEMKLLRGWLAFGSISSTGRLRTPVPPPPEPDS